MVQKKEICSVTTRYVFIKSVHPNFFTVNEYETEEAE
jgi:hypothetical protein